ncbi:hypothetical protein [Gracilibacillus sp. YIM 98692]|uniref:hypothetical protein n=1 Tax=Gracilibacillus sp. YIM 98692 TaxID=2663532 RepID=UPI0013D019AC|nr:hypothetical protein [Gracilibacillus sp. YIM 98692]
MKESIAFQQRVERLDRALLSSIEQFRSGNDHLGLDHFLHSIDDIEMLTEFHQYSGEPQEHLDKLVKVLDKIYETLKNKDVIGLTDLLEFKLSPLINEWYEKRDDL